MHMQPSKGLCSQPTHVSTLMGFVHQNIRHFYRPWCCYVDAVLRWLPRHANGKRRHYSSWHLPQKYSPNGISGAWCDDLAILVELRRVITVNGCAF